MHFDAQRPEMIVEVNNHIFRKIIYQKSGGPKRQLWVKQDECKNNKCISVCERYDSRQSFYQEFANVRIMNECRRDQKSGQSKKQAHAHCTTGVVQGKNLWTQRQHMRSKHKQYADCPQSVEDGKSLRRIQKNLPPSLELNHKDFLDVPEALNY